MGLFQKERDEGRHRHCRDWVWAGLCFEEGPKERQGKLGSADP